MSGKISSASKPQFTGPLSAFLTTSLLLKFISTIKSNGFASLSNLPVGNFFFSVLLTALRPNAPLGLNFLSLSDSATGSLVPLPVVGLPDVATLLILLPAPVGAFTSGGAFTCDAAVLRALVPACWSLVSSPASAFDLSSVFTASFGKPAAFLSRSALATSALS